MSNYQSMSNNEINSCKDVVNGLNKGITVLRIDTEEAAVFNSYGTGGQQAKMVQTNTNIILAYPAGYQIDANLIGSIMLNIEATKNDVFTDVNSLIEAIEQSSLTFDPFGSCLGLSINEAIWVGAIERDVETQALLEINSIRNDGGLDETAFKQEIHRELVDLLNSKEVSELADVLEKAKLDAINLLKTHLE